METAVKTVISKDSSNNNKPLECCWKPMHRLDGPLWPEKHGYNYFVLSKIIHFYGCYICGDATSLCIMCWRKSTTRTVNAHGPRFICAMMEHFVQVHQNFYYPISISQANGVVAYPLNSSFWSLRIFDYGSFIHLGYFMAQVEKTELITITGKVSIPKSFMLRDFGRYFLAKEHATFAADFIPLSFALSDVNNPYDIQSHAVDDWKKCCEEHTLQDAMENFMVEFLTFYCALCGKQYAAFPTEEMHFAHLDSCDWGLSSHGGSLCSP